MTDDELPEPLFDVFDAKRGRRTLTAAQLREETQRDHERWERCRRRQRRFLTVVAPLMIVGYVIAVVLAGCGSEHKTAPEKKASHAGWPVVNGRFAIQKEPAYQSVHFTGTAQSDELLGHHGNDVLRGLGGADILWGDHDPSVNPTTQVDTIYGGAGADFIYGSHGRNVIYAGAGNDHIRVHFGRGFVDCGSGFDHLHVARSRRAAYRLVHCEAIDHQPETR